MEFVGHNISGEREHQRRQLSATDQAWEMYVERPFCVHDLLHQRLVLTRREQPVPGPKFKQGGRLECWADDSAGVRDFRVCMSLSMGMAMRFVSYRCRLGGKAARADVS
jgi:hypothetical protein